MIDLRHRAAAAGGRRRGHLSKELAPFRCERLRFDTGDVTGLAALARRGVSPHVAIGCEVRDEGSPLRIRQVNSTTVTLQRSLEVISGAGPRLHMLMARAALRGVHGRDTPLDGDLKRRL